MNLSDQKLLADALYEDAYISPPDECDPNNRGCVVIHVVAPLHPLNKLPEIFDPHSPDTCIKLLDWLYEYAESNDCFVQITSGDEESPLKWHLNIIHNDGVVMFYAHGKSLSQCSAECALKILKEGK